MRGMKSESIDLIYLDPPFNSKHDYAAPIGSKAAGAAFKDTWTLDDIDNAWWGEIAETNEGLYRILDAAGHISGDSAKSYLIYMAVRLLEMHRVLKPSGSLYLHCDPTMSHHLKLVLDAIFKKENFRNEVIWFKGYRGTPRQSRYQQEHDVLLFYTKSENYVWNKTYGEYKDKNMKRYNKTDKNGKIYALIKRKRTNGEVYYGKSYPEGKLQGDVVDVPTLASTDKERTGYPTQKPLALLEKIITASSNVDDVVLDPFCGCATTCHAAARLSRKWIGIDISEKAAELISNRINQDVMVLIKGGVIHRTDIPKQAPQKSKCLKNKLYGEQEGYCKGCQYHFPIQNLTEDHIIPRSKGGQDDDKNIQLLCGNCNSIKGDRDMPYLIARLRKLKFKSKRFRGGK